MRSVSKENKMKKVNNILDIYELVFRRKTC
jgi:DNA/RNA-binding domain of Phe-tRNA-synthetase-like protein